MFRFFLLCALVGIASASYLAPAAPAVAVPAAPVLHAPSFTTSAHVGNVQSASRSYTNVPQSRFTRTDWVQPGSLITQGVFAPVLAPTYGQVAVPGPTRYDSVVVPRPPLVENIVQHVAGVAHVPVAAPAVPVAAPVYAPAPVAAPAPPAYAPAPVKGY
jgi:hypothetical protein